MPQTSTIKSRTARTGPSGSVPGAAIATTVHSESGWQPAPARGGRPRGQSRPEGDGHPAERDLRGGLPRVLVRVPAGAQPARCAGRARGRDQQHKGELHPGRRHPIVLRRGQPNLADPLPGASDRRPAHRPPHPEVAEGGCPGGRRCHGQRDGNRAGVGDLAVARQCLSALRVRSLGQALATARGQGRHDRRPLCRRHHRRLRARDGRPDASGTRCGRGCRSTRCRSIRRKPA